MLNNLNIEEILFLDIETVPLMPDYSKLSNNWKKLWEHKMQFKIDGGELPGDLYERAGIYAEFGKIICISAGYVTQKKKRILFQGKIVLR